MASSSFSSPCTYHVFLSFRGEDTRKNFTNHLYTALEQAGIHTFLDDEEIERGGNIELEIQKAIEESKIFIAVFSKDYASSSWCLDELVMMMELRKTPGNVVIPIFYDVDPSQVEMQTGNYGKAFAKHEVDFKDEMNRVNGWREALTEVAYLAGMALQDRHEAQFIKDIVREVETKLNRKILHVSPYTVGIDSYVAQVTAWLQDETTNARILIIYGIGGVGKTTIAKTVYNQSYDKFEGSTFLENIRSETDMRRLQRQVLSDILKGKSDDVYGEAKGTMMIKDAICCRRVLIVMDDVDELKQINAIIGRQEWLRPGSKIIMTARQASLLNEGCWKLEIKELNVNHSLQLFSWHAFARTLPVEGYEKLSESVVNYCGGIPLALEVLGSSLSGESIDIWESALQELQAFPNCQIQRVLRISYDCLQNDGRKNLFLDIAFFLVGMIKDRAITILDGCGYYSKAGIQSLIDKCLLRVSERNELMMHQLLRDMGREIVRQESPDEPGKRSRIWHREDAISVLSENDGTKKVKGFALNLPMVSKNESAYIFSRSYEEIWGFFTRHMKKSAPTTSDVAELGTKSFAKMRNIKLLQLNHVQFHQGFEYFPEGLIWLCWFGFPLKSIPNSFRLESLVCLDMRNSNLIDLCNGIRFLPRLKILDLSYSYGLLRTPDFSGSPNLERVIFEDCTSLVEVHESIGDLERLVLLNLRNCASLRVFPKKICMLKSLEILILSGCSRLGELPIEPKKLMEVLRFWLSLSPRKLPKPVTFSLSILPASLRELRLSNCNISDDNIRQDLSRLASLQSLDLSFNPIHCLPESIKEIPNLKALLLYECKRIQSVLALPASLTYLGVRNSKLLKNIVNLQDMQRSLYQSFSYCNGLVEIQELAKLIPMVIMDEESFESEVSFDVQLTNLMTSMTPYQLQKCTECGRSSFWIVGSGFPSWINHEDEEGAISFIVPSIPAGYKISGLRLSISCQFNDTQSPTPFPWVSISNRIKGLKWVYSSLCFTIARLGHVLWLTDWKLGKHMESGDEVEVTVKFWDRIEVIDCGIRLEIEKDKALSSFDEETDQSNSLWDMAFSGDGAQGYDTWVFVYVEKENPVPVHRFTVGKGLFYE